MGGQGRQGGQGGQGGEIVSHTHLCVSIWQDAVKSQTGTDAEVGDQPIKMSLVNYKSVNCWVNLKSKI